MYRCFTDIGLLDLTKGTVLLSSDVVFAFSISRFSFNIRKLIALIVFLALAFFINGSIFGYDLC